MRMNSETSFDESPIPWSRRLFGGQGGSGSMNSLKLHVDPPREADEPFPFPGRRQSKGVEWFAPRLAGEERSQRGAPTGRMGPGRMEPGTFDAESGVGLGQHGLDQHGHGLYTHPALEALANVERHLATLSNLVDEDDDRPRAA